VPFSSKVLARTNKPDSVPSSHLLRLLPILLCKYNSYLPAKNQLPIHVVLCISSIFWIIILDKTKSSRLPVAGPRKFYMRIKRIRSFFKDKRLVQVLTEHNRYQRGKTIWIFTWLLIEIRKIS